MSSAQPQPPNPPEDQFPGQERSAHLETMRSYDVARLESLQDMAESFCAWLHALGAEQMEKGGADAVPRVRELSNSFNNAARAARLTVTLKHEVAGLRPLRNARVAAAPANQNGPGQGAAVEANKSWHPHMYESDEAEPTDDEIQEATGNYVGMLVTAVDADIAAASPEVQALAKGESAVSRLTVIAAGIPHPNLDRALADFHFEQVWDLLAPKHAKRPPGMAPPGTDPPE